MYSASRHFSTFYSGSHLLRQICKENGSRTMTMALSKWSRSWESALLGKRLLSCSRISCLSSQRESKMFTPTFSRPANLNSQQFRNRNFTFSQCRCFSKSAENPLPKDGVTNLEEAEIDEGRKSESSDDENHGEELTGYDDMDEDLFLTEEQIQQLTKGDADLIKKIKYIQLEYSVMKQDGEKVPSYVKMKHWKELLVLNSKSTRRKFYLYLFKTEMKEQSALRKKEQKREDRLKLYAENPMPSREEDIYSTYYGLARNTLFLRLYDTTVTKSDHCRVIRAMLHHPPLVLDCSYDEHMTYREAKNCATQIELLITENRTHPEPYNLYLCNAGRETKMMEYLKRIIPTIEDDGYAINLHEECFMDIFPREKLVYLTPHTRDELEEYNEDDIYIIGAMVDKTDSRPHSFAKAKKLNLRMKRLPLDQHLMWGLGGKSLTLNQMVKIMLDVRYTRGDWKTALKHVPMRKLCRDYHPYPDQVQNEDEAGSRNDMPSTPYRKERKSYVMEDFELLNRRKGFRRSEEFASSNPRRSNQAVQAPRIKSLFEDDN